MKKEIEKYMGKDYLALVERTEYNLKWFKGLKKEYGERIVWEDEEEDVSWIFSLGDNLLGDWGEEEVEMMERRFEKSDYFELHIAMGDDIPHALEVYDIGVMTVKDREFIEKYLGENCYTL